MSQRTIFRRVFLALFAVTTLGLMAIVAYASIGLSGPQTTVDEAVAKFQAEQYTQAIRLLDRAENSLSRTSDHALRARIFAIRKDAHLQLENLPRALADLQSLVELGRSHPTVMQRLALDTDLLFLDRVYYSLRNGDGQRSLELAQEFLQEHDEHARALELAGEATFEIFAAQYAELKKELDRYWAAETAKRADEALKVWLYRHENDPRAKRSRKEFNELLEKYQAGVLNSARFRAQLEDLRRLIHQAQDYCRRAIVAPEGQPVAAYQLLRTSLDKGERFDDIQLLAETYLLRFDHIYTVDAAADLAKLHVKRGRFDAAIEIANRFLPPGAWRTRCEEARLSPEVRHLYAAKAVALATIDDREGAQLLLDEVNDVQASGLLDLTPELYLVRAHCLEALNKLGDAMTEARLYSDGLDQLPRTEQVRQALYDAVVLRGDLGARMKWSSSFTAFMFELRSRYSTNDPDPLVKKADLLLAESDGEQALQAANRARKLDEHNDEVLRIYARAIDYQESKSGGGSIDRLEAFLQQGSVPSHIPRPHLWPLIAERALDKQQYKVAYQAARAGAEEFNWARWPRLLEAKAALALGDAPAAMHAAESLLTFYPDDPDGSVLLEQARRLMGLPTEDLLYGALVNGRRDASVARSLLSRARARGAIDLASEIAQSIRTHYREDPEALLMVADFYLEQGKYYQARLAVENAAKHANSPESELYAQTSASALMIAAVERNKRTIGPLLERTKALLYGKTDELYRYAVSLSQLDQDKLTTDTLPYELAYELLTPILKDDVHREKRSGVHYELGGRLALRLGQIREAREHLTSALGFPDGVGSNRVLTLLNLHLGSGRGPADTYWERRATDLVSSCLLTRVGKPLAALRWAEETMQTAPFDVPALCLRTLLDPKFVAPDPELTRIIKEGPAALLDALTYLEAEAFEPAAVQRAQALADLFPGNRFAKLILAKALSNAGAHQQSGELLTQLMDHGDAPPFIWAHEEAARQVQQSQITDDTLVRNIISPFLGPLPVPPESTPAAQDVAIREQVKLMFQNPDMVDGALTILAAQWNRQPERVTLYDVQFLDENGRPDLALGVLKRLEPHLPKADQSNAYGIYFSLVQKLEAQKSDPQRLREARRKADRIITIEGAYGSVVHFMLDLDDLEHGSLDSERVDAGRRQKAINLLQRHILTFLDSRDTNTEALLKSLRRLSTLVRRELLLERTLDVLRHDPSLIEVWLLRADWLMRDGQLDEARKSVSWMEHFMPRHPARLRIAELDARDGVDVLRIEQELRARLGDAIVDAPEAMFTRGLLALRAAKYADARRLFGECTPAPDGGHLYYGALADLAVGEQRAAHEKIAQLAKDYPDSLLSENAGEFASFLSH